jgi:dihydroorotate dehydrogenase
LLKRAERFGAPRYASDSAAPATETAKEAVKDTVKEAAKDTKEIPRKAGRGSKKLLYGTSLALTLLVGYVYGTDTRASIHRYGIVPLIRVLYPDAEDAHHMGVDALKMLYPYGLHPRERGEPDSDGALATEVRSRPVRPIANC